MLICNGLEAFICSYSIFKVSTQCHDPNVFDTTTSFLVITQKCLSCLYCCRFSLPVAGSLFFVFRSCVFCCIFTIISALSLYLSLKVTHVTQALRHLLESLLLDLACPFGWLVEDEGVLSSSQDERAAFLYIPFIFVCRFVFCRGAIGSEEPCLVWSCWWWWKW